MKNSISAVPRSSRRGQSNWGYYRGYVASSLPSAADFYGDSWAVVIGINEYTNARVPKLQYAVNDARAIQQSLLKLGFRHDRVITLFDAEATKTRIEGIVGDDLRLKVRPNDRVLVFFAGHGKTDRRRSGEPEGSSSRWTAIPTGCSGRRSA